jgi:hypothetical protein
VTWFRVDDKLHSHPKAVRAGASAMGFWLLAGSWCADQLTDGWIPDYIAARIDPTGWQQNAARLVAVGLWHPETRHAVTNAVSHTDDVENGWVFHEWNEHQPSREQVLGERRAAADRQKRARERAREKRSNAGQTGHTDAESHAVTHGEVTPVVTVPPTRPDPTNKKRTTSSSSTRVRAKPAQRIPDDFSVTTDMVEWARQHCPDIDGRTETERFRDHWRAADGRNAVKRDWTAAWRNWMRTAQERAPRPRNVLAMPANGNRPSTTDQRVNQALALAARYHEEDQR